MGKTEIILCACGYFSHYEPSPILALHPTLEMGEAWSKDRLAPMVRDSPALREVFPDPKSRSAGNTIRHKAFPGGHVTIVGANAPAGLAMRPIRVLLADEIDRYPASAGTEGSPLRLARRRTATFWNRKIVVTSSPTLKGSSAIWRELESGTFEEFHVPCPSCGARQVLVFSQVRWERGDPSTARYQCEACDALWGEPERVRAIDVGEWVARYPARGRRHRSFHVSELYSPWSSLETIVEAFLAARHDPAELQVVVNTSFAQLWEGEGETLDAEELHDRRRHELTAVPVEADTLTAGVDVQNDRIEAEIVAWDSVSRSSWSLLYRVIDGDPRIRPGAQGSPWDELDELLAGEYVAAAGAPRKVRAAFIDAGFLFDEVCAWCKPRARRGIYASRGEGGQGKPWLIGRSRNNRHRAQVWRLGVDAIKGTIYRRLAVEDPGTPGYCAFPTDYTLDYFAQLTAERAVTRYRAGHPSLVWELPGGARNEALDCRVYAEAALERVRPRRAAAVLRRTTASPTLPAGDDDTAAEFGRQARGDTFTRGNRSP